MSISILLPRNELEGEAAVIAMLAKIEPSKLTFSADKLTEGSGDGGDIQIVVAEGLQVAVPMAGALFNFHSNHCLLLSSSSPNP